MEYMENNTEHIEDYFYGEEIVDGEFTETDYIPSTSYESYEDENSDFDSDIEDDTVYYDESDENDDDETDTESKEAEDDSAEEDEDDAEEADGSEDPSDFDYAPWWKRLVAFAIDTAAIGIVLRLIFPNFHKKFPGFLHSLNWLFDLAVSIPGIINLVAEAFYLIYFWTDKGQTPGQMVMGIKVVKKNGDPLTRTDSMVRFVGYIISGAVLGLGFIWAAFDEDKQGLLDKMAGTVVVNCRTATEETAETVSADNIETESI